MKLFHFRRWSYCPSQPHLSIETCVVWKSLEPACFHRMLTRRHGASYWGLFCIWTDAPVAIFDQFSASWDLQACSKRDSRPPQCVVVFHGFLESAKNLHNRTRFCKRSRLELLCLTIRRWHWWEDFRNERRDMKSVNLRKCYQLSKQCVDLVGVKLQFWI